MFCGIKNPRTRNVRHFIVYKKTARRENCFVKADVEFVLHVTAGVTEPLWWTVATAAKKELSAFNCTVKIVPSTSESGAVPRPIMILGRGLGGV
jgi:hypothetical protein